MRFEEIIKESPTLTRNFRRDIKSLSEVFSRLHEIFITRRNNIELDKRYDAILSDLNTSFSQLEDLENQNLKFNKG